MMVKQYHNDFPILKREFYGKPLTYLDSAATSQKPQSVIDAVSRSYAYENANVHRGIYALSEEATQAYELSRLTLKQFLHAQSHHEIIFTKGTTEAINLVASSFGDAFIHEGDEILISAMEHHSNIVPWQLLCQRKKAQLKIIPISDQGVIDFQAYQQLLTPKVKMVGIVHISNVLGIVNPIKTMIAMAHALKIPVLIDGAQALSHVPVDVVDLDCDFYAFSAHKMYGPTGIGGLYAKEKWLEKMPPYQGGGDMISYVTFDKTNYNVLPYKFEAGTPNMAGVAGFRAAIDYINAVGFETIQAHERVLYAYAEAVLKEVPGLTIIGEAPHKMSVISFTLDHVHPHDVATILDQDGVAVRAGHHCAMPLMDRLGLASTVRMSLALYNNREDIDRLCAGLLKTIAIFS